MMYSRHNLHPKIFKDLIPGLQIGQKVLCTWLFHVLEKTPEVLRTDVQSLIAVALLQWQNQTSTAVQKFRVCKGFRVHGGFG